MIVWLRDNHIESAEQQNTRGRYQHPEVAGNWETISPNTRQTMSWPSPTNKYVHHIGGPPATMAVAKIVYTPTTGERYVNPSAKFSHFDMVRSKWEV